MKVKNIIDEDFTNYKKPSMFIGTSNCDFKCDKECGKPVCQNSELAKAPTIEIDDNEIIKRFDNNSISEAIVIGGLEPFDTFDEIYDFINLFRKNHDNDIVIYTGYYPDEVEDKIFKMHFKNIIIKFGRFEPDRLHRFDKVLGIELASNNQFAVTLENYYKYYKSLKKVSEFNRRFFKKYWRIVNE